MVGYAVTATIRSETPFPDAAAKADADDAALRRRRSGAEGPKVVVVQDLDGGAGLPLGRGQLDHLPRRSGCEGVVTDGLVRDLPDVEAIGFRYLARGVGVARAWVEIVEQPASRSRSAACRSQPGDVVHADRHGALRHPARRPSTACPPPPTPSSPARSSSSPGSAPPSSTPAEIAARRAQH